MYLLIHIHIRSFPISHSFIRLSGEHRMSQGLDSLIGFPDATCLPALRLGVCFPVPHFCSL